MGLVLTTVARARRKAAFAAVSAEVVTDFLQAAEDWVHSYCDRNFVLQNYSAIYNGKGGDTLYLKSWPVTAIVSCAITDDSGSVETLTPATDLIYQAENGAVRFSPQSGAGFDEWPEGFQNIAVTYTAGHSVIPDAVQEAVTLKALCLFAESGSDMNAALVSQQVGEANKTRNPAAIIDGWQKQVEALLAPYRRLEF